MFKIIPRLNLKQIKRFFKKIPIASTLDDCWEWESQLNNRDYGVVKINGIIFSAHRVSYFIHYKTDPKEMLVCHKCDNPKCVNPSHLFLGTTKDNAQDALKKGRIGDDRLRRHQILHPESMANGSRNGQSKVTESQVIDIRNEYATGLTSLNKLGTKYGINGATVFSIIHKQTWTHV